MEQPISELHLPYSSPLVLCLRPRLPQPLLDRNAIQDAAQKEGREKLAEELLENGQASKDGGGEEKGDNAEDGKELKELKAAQMQLEAMETNLVDTIKKREDTERTVQV